ncbi:unnamed protein product [Amoebophrya sp. A25]|nr:unnamed protein product [Amoebophrya sp. A25]CAD7976774.1 unnamed protein product [Amoebophrya sp. A25]|eukprot:GSA25T00027476001.1
MRDIFFRTATRWMASDGVDWTLSTIDFFSWCYKQDQI